MVTFGNVLASVIVELLTLIEGTLSHYVDITFMDGNMTDVSLSPAGELFCQNWADLLVSFAGAMNSMLTALWSTSF